MQLTDKYVLIVNECRSVTEAARKIGISQPSLSMSIANVEKRLGYQIFDRKSNPITTTKLGAIYIEYLKQLGRIDHDYEKRIADLVEPGMCSITVGGPSVYVASILMEVSALFHEREPECRITIKEMSLPKLIEETVFGTMDCFISTTSSLPEDLVVEKLKQECIHLCIPKSWAVNEELKAYQVSPGKNKGQMDYQKLNDLPVISMLPEMPMQLAVNQFCEQQEIRLKRTMVVDQTLVGLRLAAKGIGMFFASDEALRDDELRKKLNLYSLPPQIAGRQLYVARNSRGYQSNVCEKYVQLLKEATKK